MTESMIERHEKELGGVWRFCPDMNGDGEELGFPGVCFVDRLWREVEVPSCFEAGCASLDHYEGICWYRRGFDLPGDWLGKRVLVRFEGVNYRSRVWLNGNYVGDNRDGFLPFEFELDAGILRLEGNVLAVEVDNRHHEGDVPGMHVGWRGFGGILREVRLIATDPLHLDKVRIVAEPDGEAGVFELGLEVCNRRSRAENVDVVVCIFDGGGRLYGEFTVDPLCIGCGNFERLDVSGRVAGIQEWSPESPALYRAEVRLQVAGDGVDGCEVRFGFRRIEATANGLLLNGKRVFLTGFNLHEDSPRTGMAVDPECRQRDFDMMKEAGCNAVRLAHYPHDSGALDYCDAVGLLVLAEIPLYHWNKTQMEEGKRTNAARVKSAARQLERMITRDFNHPSVIMWSVSNETQEGEAEVAESNRELIRLGRSLDPSRLHVHVSDHWYNYPNFAEDDVICINYYPSVEFSEGATNGGHNPAAYDPQQIAEKWRSKLRELRQQYPTKPVVVAEFGYASFAGTFGHSFGEDEHARVLRAEFAAFDESLVCGSFVWVWADHAWPAGRQLGKLGVSPFGVVTRERRPLAPYYAIRELYRRKQGMVGAPAGGAVRNKSTRIVMIRWHMDALPEIDFPQGYSIRPMGPDDVSLWTDIQRDAEEFLDIGDDLFRREFGDDPATWGRRCFIITDPRGLGVGTISAWYDRDFKGAEWGRIHWVAVRPSAQRKGLGQAALAYAMRVAAQWHDKCYLVTATERRAAVALYDKFGFVVDTGE